MYIYAHTHTLRKGDEVEHWGSLSASLAPCPVEILFQEGKSKGWDRTWYLMFSAGLCMHAHLSIYTTTTPTHTQNKVRPKGTWQWSLHTPRADTQAHTWTQIHKYIHRYTKLFLEVQIHFVYQSTKHGTRVCEAASNWERRGLKRLGWSRGCARFLSLQDRSEGLCTWMYSTDIYRAVLHVERHRHSDY